MITQIKETNLANAPLWQGVTVLDHDLLLTDRISDIPVPSDARRMNFILVMLCTQGSLRYTLDTNEVTVNAGDMLIVTDRHVVNNYVASPDVAGMAFLMSVTFFREVVNNVSDLSAILLYARAHPVMKLPDDEAKVFEQYFQLIRNRVSAEGNRFRKSLVRSLLQALFYELSDTIYQAQSDGSPMRRREALFTNFIKMVEEHCHTERRVGWYAGQLNITPKYLSELVKSVSQRTPNEWIDSYVLIEIRIMLKNSNKSIKEIADNLNFPNQSFFGKYFKERMGMSPSEFRRKQL